MMPLRFGYAWMRPWVSWKDFWSSSSPYATLTSFMSLYLGSLSVSFITLIQAFWFVAFAVADRIAISPLLSICLAIDSTWFSPTSLVVTWLMKTLRASGAT